MLAADERAKQPGAVETPAAALEAARRDFEAVKSLRSLGSEPRPQLPAVAMPRVPGDARLSTPSGAGRAAPSPQSPKSNWLLEAMAEAREPAGTASGNSPRKMAGSADEAPLTRAPTAHSLERNPPMAESNGGAANPFSGYLKHWMSPQDFAVLGSALHAAPIGGLAPGPGLPVGGGNLPAVGEAQASALLPATKPDPLVHRDSRRTEERKNPYLEALMPPRRADSVALGGNPAIASPQTPSGKVHHPVGPEVLPPRIPLSEVRNQGSASRIPEFVRPAGDEKHFKPLKRF